MEQFSRAYVQAVAASAGCSFSTPSVDNDSVDLTLYRRSPGTPVRSPRLDLQLKATGADCIHDNDVAFPLSLKNYDDLRPTDVAVPRMLVVVAMPAEIQEWMEHDEERLALRRCGYWFSLRGLPHTPNQTQVTVRIPRANRFDPTGLHNIFTRLEQGGEV
jgi:hypothetical protein